MFFELRFLTKIRSLLWNFSFKFRNMGSCKPIIVKTLFSQHLQSSNKKLFSSHVHSNKKTLQSQQNEYLDPSCQCPDDVCFVDGTIWGPEITRTEGKWAQIKQSEKCRLWWTSTWKASSKGRIWQWFSVNKQMYLKMKINNQFKILTCTHIFYAKLCKEVFMWIYLIKCGK